MQNETDDFSLENLMLVQTKKIMFLDHYGT